MPLRVIWLAMFGATLAYVPVAWFVARGGPSPWLGAAWLAAAVAGGSSFAARALADRTSDPQAAAARQIVCWALCEAVAIIGLVVAVLGGTFPEFLPFAGVAAGLLVWHRPGAERKVSPGNRAHGGGQDA